MRLTLRRVLSALSAACVVAAGAAALGATGVAAAQPTVQAVGNPGIPGDTPGSFAYIKPARIVDTRRGLGGSPAGPNGTTTVSVTGRADIPSSVGAVQLNVTVVGTASGYATVYPAGSSRPVASNVNFEKGIPVSNDVTVAPGTDGKITLYAYSRGTTQFIIDARGYYGAGTATAAGAFVPTTPTRVLDTRRGLGAGENAAPNVRLNVPIAGHAGVPSDASAVLLNLTATGSQRSGYLAPSPAGSSSGGTSAVNFRAGKSVPNLVTEPLGTGGAITILNASNGRTGVLADVLGYYRGGTPTVAGTFVPIAPTRVVDTARHLGLAPFGPNDRQVLGSVTGVPRGADSVALNITIANETKTSYFTANSGAHLPPSISTVNYQRHVTIAHGTLNGTGHFDFYNRAGHVRAIVDATGYFVGPSSNSSGGSIAGRVTDASTGAATGRTFLVQIFLPPPYGSDINYSPGTTTTDSAGGYTYPALTPGKYVVCVSDNSTAPVYRSECYDNQSFNGKVPQDSVTPVTVAVDKATTVDFGVSR